VLEPQQDGIGGTGLQPGLLRELQPVHLPRRITQQRQQHELDLDGQPQCHTRTLYRSWSLSSVVHLADVVEPAKLARVTLELRGARNRSVPPRMRRARSAPDTWRATTKGAT